MSAPSVIHKDDPCHMLFMGSAQMTGALRQECSRHEGAERGRMVLVGRVGWRHGTERPMRGCHVTGGEWVLNPGPDGKTWGPNVLNWHQGKETPGELTAKSSRLNCLEPPKALVATSSSASPRPTRCSC